MEAIFATPTPKNIEWRKVESMLMALGCEIIEGNGSRVAFSFEGKRVDFHRPHPNKEAKPYQIKAAVEYIKLIGKENEHDEL